MNFLHIGGGAGDLDPSTNFRDGFSEFVKKYRVKKKNIFIVEANPSNISTLKKSWAKYKSVRIFNVAISNKRTKKIKFFLVKKMLLTINFFQVTLNILKYIFQDLLSKTKLLTLLILMNF